MLRGVHCLWGLLRLVQCVFSQDVPLQPFSSSSPQRDELKHRGTSLWQVPIANCDVTTGRGPRLPVLSWVACAPRARSQMTMTHRRSQTGRNLVSWGDREDQGSSLEDRAPELGTEDPSVLTASLICCFRRSGVWGPADPGRKGHARRW